MFLSKGGPVLPYPDTPKRPIIDQIHGHELVDPYRWLEDGERDEVRVWTQEETQLTHGIIESYPDHQQWLDTLDLLSRTARVSLPRGRGGTWLYTRRDADQDHDVLYAFQETTRQETLIVDPHVVGQGDPLSVDWFDVSSNGQLIAYGMSPHGNEWSTLYLYNLESKALLDDRIIRARYATVAFLPDLKSFFYTRYAHPGEVPDGEEFYRIRVYQHVIGAPEGEDRLVFQDPHDKKAMPSVSLSGSGRYLLVNVSYGWTRTVLWIQDLYQPQGQLRCLFDHGDVLAHTVWDDDVLYVLTNLEADTNRLVTLDLEDKSLHTIIPSHPQSPLVDVSLTQHRIYASYIENAVSALRYFNREGCRLGSVPLPTLSHLTGISSQQHNLYFSYTGFDRPLVIARMGDTETTPLTWFETPRPPSGLVVKLDWAVSHDGTRIPIHIAHPRGITLNGKNPTVLSGYGGFNVANLPAYSASIEAWVRQGGVFAQALIRGGSEFGETWHRSGMRENKQNVFDDFYAASQHLKEEGYTDARHLGVTGRSNGGLLTGAFITQHPDAAEAAIVGVPLLDMARFHRFLIADIWTDEYGSPEVASQFDWIMAYSPYHHVTPGTAYPATLLFTSSEDSRVDPMHARKMTALLQSATASDRPILLRVLESAGHGVGKTRSQWVQEEADIWTFLGYHLGIS